MVADDVDHRAPCPPGVVQVGEPIAQTGAEMEEGGRRPAGHPCIAVGCTGRHPFEQGEHAVHGLDLVEGGDEVHLRGARVHEADIDSVVDEGAHERIGSVHLPAPFLCRRWSVLDSAGSRSKMVPGLRMPTGSKMDLIRR